MTGILAGIAAAFILLVLGAIVASYHEHEMRHRRGESCAICDAREYR